MSESAWGKASWPPDFLCSIFDAFLDMGRRPTATHSFRAVQRKSGAIRTKARSNFDLEWYCPPVYYFATHRRVEVVYYTAICNFKPDTFDMRMNDTNVAVHEGLWPEQRGPAAPNISIDTRTITKSRRRWLLDPRRDSAYHMMIGGNWGS